MFGRILSAETPIAMVSRKSNVFDHFRSQRVCGQPLHSKMEEGRKSVVHSTSVCIIEEDGPMGKGCFLVAAPILQVAFASEVSPRLDAHLFQYA